MAPHAMRTGRPYGDKSNSSAPIGRIPSELAPAIAVMAMAWNSKFPNQPLTVDDIYHRLHGQPDEIWTDQHIADYTGFSRSWVRDQRKADRLPAFKAGLREYRFWKSDVLAFLAQPQEAAPTASDEQQSA